MDPNQQQPGGFNSQQYDFINNPAPKPKKSLLPSFGGGKAGKIIFFFVSVSVILIVLILLFNLFFGGSSNLDEIKQLAKKQAEIVRVSEVGVDKARSTETESFAISTQTVLKTDQNKTVAYLSSNGVKVGDKDLSSTDSKTDQELQGADTNGTFDTIFTAKLVELLQDYGADLKSIYENTEGKKGQTLLSESYDNVQILIENAPNAN